MEVSSYAKLKGRNFEFYMMKKRIVIGRKSKQGDVDVNMGSSRFISRRHLEIALDRNSFYFVCRGKNGVYIDEAFQRHENKRLQLPTNCIIRFPSTKIELAFDSLLTDMGPLQPMHSPALPLKVDTQFPSPFVSPAPSPTGTISAVNSCPVSPTSAYRHHMPNFDLKAMASYATKLLSNNNQTESAETGGDSNSNVASPNQAFPDHAQAPPTTAERGRDGEEEGEEDEDEENHGDVPNDVIRSKPGKINVMEGVKVPASERTQQKPPFSYAQLIVQALLASKDRRQTLSSIYAFISDMYPYYKLEDKGWKNSIRHNLSLNQYFMKAAREKEGLGFGKGGYWCMHPDYEDKLTSQAFVKRKKKGIPVFPSAHLVSRSAPPSPTHHPINDDINLKSIESKFTLPVPPTSSHFTLPPFFSQMPSAAMNSSHSLPASPSRPPPGFTATPLKFFPIVQGRTSDDLDLIKAQRMAAIATIHEEQDEDEKPSLPLEKRPRLEEHQPEGSISQHQQQQQQAQVLSIPNPAPPGMAMSGPPRMNAFATPGIGPFLPISLMQSAPSHIQQPHQSLLAAPLSSFLPQSYFAPRAVGGAGPMLPPGHVSTAGEVRGSRVALKDGGPMGETSPGYSTSPPKELDPTTKLPLSGESLPPQQQQRHVAKYFPTTGKC